jgi:ribosomal protein L13E
MMKDLGMIVDERRVQENRIIIERYNHRSVIKSDA